MLMALQPNMCNKNLYLREAGVPFTGKLPRSRTQMGRTGDKKRFLGLKK
jgi:hypothetical protein